MEYLGFCCEQQNQNWLNLERKSRSGSKENDWKDMEKFEWKKELNKGLWEGSVNHLHLQGPRTGWMHLWAVKYVVGAQAPRYDSLLLYPASLYLSLPFEMGVMDFAYGAVMSIE